MANPYYTDYSEYLDRFFPGRKIQKISVNTGGTCPNRDGTLGYGGCIYCNNHSFTPSYCFGNKTIAEQIESGKSFFSKKYKEMDFLVYFQSFTSTYQKSAADFRKLLIAILSIDKIKGIVLGTRPDCLNMEMIEMLGEVNNMAPVFVELGVESMHDETLNAINRGHNSRQTEETITSLACNGLHTGVHLIAGLPGETDNKIYNSVKRLCDLGIESIKMHQLQVLKDTVLHKKLTKGELRVKPYTLEEYLDFCIGLIRIVPRRIAIERFLASAPPEMVVSPKWGLKNYEFTNMMLNKIKKNEK